MMNDRADVLYLGDGWGLRLPGIGATYKKTPGNRLAAGLLVGLFVVGAGHAQAQSVVASQEHSASLVTDVEWDVHGADKGAATVLSAQRKQLIGQTLDEKGASQVADTVTKSLRHAGYVIATAVELPADREQFFASGRLKVTIFLGEVGAVEIKNTSRVNTERLRRVAMNALCSRRGGRDCVLTSAKLERALQLLRDIPGVQVGVPELSPEGVGVGQTKLIIGVQPSGKLITGAISADNNGVSATGRNEVQATATITNLFHAGDVLNLSIAETSRAQTTGLIDFSAPLGYQGLRWDASAAHMLYTLPGVNTAGTADVGTLGIAYPLVRGLDENVQIALDGKFAHSSSSVLGFTTSNKNLYGFQLSLSGNSGDRTMQSGGSYSTGRVSFLSGQVQDNAVLGDPANELGRYSKMSFDTTRKQNLDASGNWYAIAHIRGQLSTDNLDPYEKMTIGGATGVRAFGVDEGSYDEGVIATLSFARRFVLPTGDLLAPNLFVDYANGYVNHSPYANWQALGGYVNNGLSNHRILAGYGIGLDWVNPHGALVSVSWSRPFATSSSSINNPEEYGSHVWLTLGFRF